MKIKTLSISNFLSFGENVVFDTDNLGNLILVEGEVSGGEGSNGAGKSSLFEAVYWSLTGSTVRGVRAKDVVRNGEKSVRVVVEFDLRDARIRVDRFWSEKKKEVVVFVGGEEERFHDSKQGTERIFEVLGISPKLLAIVSFYGRKFVTFSSLSPKERAEIIDVLARGEIWEKARVEARSRNSDAEKRIEFVKEELRKAENTLEFRQSVVKGQEDKIKEMKVEFESMKSKFEKEVVEMEVKLSDYVKENKGRVKELEEFVEGLESKIERWKEDESREVGLVRESVEDELDKLTAQLIEDESTLKTLDKLILVDEGSIKDFRREIEDLKRDKENDTCSKCGQKLPNPPDVKRIDKEIEILEGEASKAKLHIKECEQSVEGMRGLVAETQIKIDKIKKDVELRVDEVREKFVNLRDESVKKVKDNDEEMRGIKGEEERLRRELEELRRELSSVDRGEIDREEGVLRRFREELVEMLDGQRENKKRIKDLDKESGIYKYWEKGFKDLRFAGFEGAINVLRELLNAFCRKEGLDFDAIEVEAWREKADGGKAAEVNLYIIRGEDRMRVDAMSEGEGQRIDLACFFTFGALIEKCLGFDIGFNVLDEPLGGLDYEGRQNVFNLISEQSERKQMFVIDHDANFKDLFGDVVTVVKEGGVSGIK